MSDAREHPLLKDNPAIEEYDAISYCGVPIVDREDRVLGTLCVVDEEVRTWSHSQLETLTDIAQSVMAEVHLRLLAAELENKNAALREFMAIASHDIRSPLSIILNYAYLLGDDGFDLEDSEKKQFIGSITEEARRAARLVSDLMDVTKLESGIEEPRTQTVEVRSIVDKESLGTTNGSVVVDVEEGLAVLADPDDLRRIISTLIDNASKYGEPPIRLQAGSRESTAVLSVSDEGEGVPAEFIPELFEKFARSEQSSRAGIRGSGLGLAIARGLAEKNGGTLYFEPNRPRGSRFVVELPRADGSGSPE